MGIRRADMPEFWKNNAALAGLISEGYNKQKAQAQQKDLNVQQAQEMVPIEQQTAQNKSDIAVNQLGKEQQQTTQNVIGGAQAAQQAGVMNDGGSFQLGEKSGTIGKGVNQQANQDKQDKLLNAEARELDKLTKPIQDNADVLEQIRTIHELGNSPNAYDQKNIGIMQARIAEGKGQRLLQGVINTFGARGESVPGWAANMLNKVQGGAASTLTPEEMRQLVEHTHKMGDEYSQRFNDSINQYNQKAPLTASRTMQVDPSRLDRMRDASAQRGMQAMQSINASKQKYQTTAQEAGRQVPSPAAPQEQGLVNWFAGKLGLGGSSQAPQQAPQQRSGLSPEQEARRQELLKKAGK